MRRLGKWAHAHRAGLCLASASVLIIGITACSSASEEPQTSNDGFASFEVGANDSSFYAPIDAVPMDDGSLVFLARATNSAMADRGEEEEARAQRGDLTLVYHQPVGGKPVVIYDQLVLATNIASDGKDAIYVADYGASAIVRISLAGRSGAPVATNVEPKGVAVGPDGKVVLTGTNVATRLPGIYTLDGDTATPIVEGGILSNLSGVDIDDNGVIYAVSATGSADVDEEFLAGSGRGVIYRIEGGIVSVLSAGFEAAEPSGLAVVNNILAVSSYEGRGASSAVLLYDLVQRKLDPTVYTNDKLAEITASGGLHRNVTTGLLAWSGGNTVFAIKP